VADYPFTTLRPHLGVVRGEREEFVVADVPGLVEGASEGRGLGHQFLRHVERASALAVLLDLGPVAERPPEEQLRVLLAELGSYQPDLLERPRLVVGTKADVAAGVARTPSSGSEDPGPEDLRISAVTGEGVPELVRRMETLVGEARAARAAARTEPQHYVVHRPVREGVRIERDPSGELVVHGREAERAVAVSDLTNAQALAYVQDRLRRLGVDRALARAGAR
jgi:GTP-binding protein